VLAVLAMVSAVIAAYLYLRIMVSMWLSATPSAHLRYDQSLSVRAVVFLTTTFTLLFGTSPALVTKLLLEFSMVR